MEFREQVLNLLAEVAENDIVKENPDVEIFEEGIIDSFQTVGLLLEIQNKLDMKYLLWTLIEMSGQHQIKSLKH